MTESIRNAIVGSMFALLAAPAAFSADATKGKVVFDARCGICHSATAAPGGAVAGPNIFGIMGRKAAAVEGFSFYTPALKNSGITWNEKIMDEFLANPMAKVPGTTMVIALPDPRVRTDVIAYLKTLKK